ncbi:MAG: flagellar biosynthesis anti-sigma factor FlgM [Planctomycetota bacterium]
MQIRPTSGVQNTTPIQLNTQNRTQSVETSNSLPQDQLDISTNAQTLSVEAGQNNVAEVAMSSARANRVAELKAQIQSGTYDTPERFDAAVSKMINEIA